MAVITNALLASLRTGFMMQFQQAQTEAPSDYKKIATIVPSTTASNTYGWMSKAPNFREWVGDRVIKDISEFSYQISNKDWESTVGVDRNDIEDDNLGVYAPLFQEMGIQTARHPDKLAFPLLTDGENQLCYDGQNFFDTDHPVYANHDGTGAVSTVSNFEDGTEIPFYLLDTTRAIKPIIFQKRKAPVFTAMTDPKDEDVFMRKQFRFGVDSRSNVGYGLWQFAYKSKAGLTADNFNAAFQAMQELKNDGDTPMGITPNLLVVPPAYRAAALEIVKAERNANGATNINRNAVEVLATPWLV